MCLLASSHQHKLGCLPHLEREGRPSNWQPPSQLTVSHLFYTSHPKFWKEIFIFLVLTTLSHLQPSSRSVQRWKPLCCCTEEKRIIYSYNMVIVWLAFQLSAPKMTPSLYIKFFPLLFIEGPNCRMVSASRATVFLCRLKSFLVLCEKKQNLNHIRLPALNILPKCNRKL